TFRSVFNDWNFGLDFREPYTHLLCEGRAFAGPHLLKVVERGIHGLFDSRRCRFVEAIASSSHRSGEARHGIDINVTRQLKFGLNVAQSFDVTADQCPIDFVVGCASAFEVDVQIDTPARQSPADKLANVHLERAQLLAEPQMNIEVAIVDSLNLDADFEVFAGRGTSTKSSH